MMLAPWVSRAPDDQGIGGVGRVSRDPAGADLAGSQDALSRVGARVPVDVPESLPADGHLLAGVFGVHAGRHPGLPDLRFRRAPSVDLVLVVVSGRRELRHLELSHTQAVPISS